MIGQTFCNSSMHQINEMDQMDEVDDHMDDQMEKQLDDEMYDKMDDDGMYQSDVSIHSEKSDPGWISCDEDYLHLDDPGYIPDPHQVWWRNNRHNRVKLPIIPTLAEIARISGEVAQEQGTKKHHVNVLYEIQKRLKVERAAEALKDKGAAGNEQNKKARKVVKRKAAAADSQANQQPATGTQTRSMRKRSNDAAAEQAGAAVKNITTDKRSIIRYKVRGKTFKWDEALATAFSTQPTNDPDEAWMRANYLTCKQAPPLPLGDYIRLLNEFRDEYKGLEDEIDFITRRLQEEGDEEEAAAAEKKEKQNKRKALRDGMEKLQAAAPVSQINQQAAAKTKPRSTEKRAKDAAAEPIEQPGAELRKVSVPESSHGSSVPSNIRRKGHP